MKSRSGKYVAEELQWLGGAWRFPPLPKGKSSARGRGRKEWKPLELKLKGVAWQQGEIWITVSPPFDEESTSYSTLHPRGVKIVSDPSAAYSYITRDLGVEITPDSYREWSGWFSAEQEVTI